MRIDKKKEGGNTLGVEGDGIHHTYRVSVVTDSPNTTTVHVHCIQLAQIHLFPYENTSFNYIIYANPQIRVLVDIVPTTYNTHITTTKFVRW